MRVAMLGQYPLAESRILGGIEAVMVPLLRGLSRFADLDLHVITCQPGAQEGLRAAGAGVPLRVLRRKHFGRLTFQQRDVSSIRRVLDSLSPDVVHAQGVGIYAAAAVSSPYPCVVTVHGIVFREARFASGLAARLRTFMDSLYEKYWLRQIRNYIAISPYVEEELGRLGSFQRVYRIENPVDEMFFDVGDAAEEATAPPCLARAVSPRRAGSCGPNGDERSEAGRTVLYAGRVIPRKGLLELLRALVEVRETVPRVCLRVAGETDSDPAYFNACRQFITAHALEEAVSYLGPLTMQQMAGEYARCAILALPSKQETAPVVVAEAMAAGRPVIAARACGIPYMVEDGQSGLLVEYGDVAGWTHALTLLLSQPADRGRMGHRGRELARARFHPEVVAHATRAAYFDLAGGGPRLRGAVRSR